MVPGLQNGKVVMMAAKSMFALLQMRGYFGGRETRKYSHNIPELPAVTQRESITLVRDLVAVLDSVRQRGSLRCGSALMTKAPDWLEALGYIKAVWFQLDDPLLGEVMYEVTPLGVEFLKVYEAPEWW
jgi:hypothetical protein